MSYTYLSRFLSLALSVCCVMCALSLSLCVVSCVLLFSDRYCRYAVTDFMGFEL